MSEKYDTLEVAGKALYAINVKGFVSKKSATDSNPSTAHLIKTNDPSLDFYSAVGNTTKFLQWVHESDVVDNFMAKGRSAFLKEYMSDWEIPFAVALVNKYLNEKERNKKIAHEKEKFKNSEYQGNIGERNEYFIKFYGVKLIKTDDASYYIHTFHDRYNNVYTILKPQKLEHIEIGDCVLIRGTVKQHKEFNGIKQTNLNRPKIIWNSGKKEDQND